MRTSSRKVARTSSTYAPRLGRIAEWQFDLARHDYVALTNNISNPTSIIQAISDIFFTASGVTGGGGLKTPTANLVTIGDDRSPLVGNPQWLLTNTSGNNYHLDVLAGPASGPATLIIGPGPYTNANGSITAMIRTTRSSTHRRRGGWR